MPDVLESIPPLEPEDGRTLYRIAASLDAAAHVVAGEARILWTNRSAVATDDLFLYLHLDAFRDAGTRFLRESGGELRGERFRGPGRMELLRVAVDGTDVLDGSERSETWIRLRLPAPIPPGESATVEASFEAHLPPVFARTGWSGSFHLAAQWFPKVPVRSAEGEWLLRARGGWGEFFAEHADWDVTLDVPDGFTTGAPGTPAAPGGTPADGRNRLRFVLRRAVDFAFAAWDRFRVADEEIGGIRIRWLYPPEAQETLARQRAAVAGALPRFVERLGPPPTDRLVVVLVPRDAEGAGGMEYAGFITTTASPELPGYRDDQEVAVHELAHQWFHALVASDESGHPWMDEGTVTWVTGVVLDDLFGADRSMVSAGPLAIGYGASRRACWRLGRPEVPGHLAAEAYASAGSYGSAVYCRAGLAFDALAAACGREAVFAALGDYTAAHRFTLAGPDDLLAALGRGCGRGPVDTVFRPALEAVGTFDLALADVAVDREDGDGEGRGWTTRFTVVRRGADVRVPVRTEVRFGGAAVDARWDGSGDRRSFAVRSDRPPESIAIDPDREVLLDADLTNNGWRRESPAGTTGLLDEIVLVFGALFGGLL
jgi:hypothetical protein